MTRASRIYIYIYVTKAFPNKMGPTFGILDLICWISCSNTCLASWEDHIIEFRVSMCSYVGWQKYSLNWSFLFASRKLLDGFIITLARIIHIPKKGLVGRHHSASLSFWEYNSCFLVSRQTCDMTFAEGSYSFMLHDWSSLVGIEADSRATLVAVFFYSWDAVPWDVLPSLRSTPPSLWSAPLS